MGMASPRSVSGKKSLRRYGSLAIALLAGFSTSFLLSVYSGWPRESVFMAGIFALAAILWATEALPLFATSLLVIGLEIIFLANPGGWSGIGFGNGPSPTYQEILHTAADPILLLFFGGFLLAQGATKEGVDRAVSSLLLAPFEKQARTLLLGVLCVTATFSMWMSNTATAAMMIALVAPIVVQLPISTPPNAIACASGEISTRDLLRVGLTLGIVAAVLIVFLLGPLMRWIGTPGY